MRGRLAEWSHVCSLLVPGSTRMQLAAPVHLLSVCLDACRREFGLEVTMASSFPAGSLTRQRVPTMPTDTTAASSVERKSSDGGSVCSGGGSSSHSMSGREMGLLAPLERARLQVTGGKMVTDALSCMTCIHGMVCSVHACGWLVVITRVNDMREMKVFSRVRPGSPAVLFYAQYQVLPSNPLAVSTVRYSCPVSGPQTQTSKKRQLSGSHMHQCTAWHLLPSGSLCPLSLCPRVPTTIIP